MHHQLFDGDIWLTQTLIPCNIFLRYVISSSCDLSNVIHHAYSSHREHLQTIIIIILAMPPNSRWCCFMFQANILRFFFLFLFVMEALMNRFMLHVCATTLMWRFLMKYVLLSKQYNIKQLTFPSQNIVTHLLHHLFYDSTNISFRNRVF